MRLPLTGAALSFLLIVPSAGLAQEAAGDVLTPFQVTRVERFLENRAACLGCHRIDGAGGAIGPALDGLAQRVDRAYVAGVIRDPVGTVPGTIMPRQTMPAPEAERLTSYLMGRPAIPNPTSSIPPQAPPALGPNDRLNGAALYARHCAACHGAEGRGDGWNAGNLPTPPTAHADGEAMSKRADDTLYDAISAGGFVLDKSPRMPAFGTLLVPEQIRALVAQIRVLCGCEQPVWARGQR